MALVFTALADSGCELMLWAKQRMWMNGGVLWDKLDPKQCIALALVSIGLYGFGMSLNDIIDRRRDRQISPQRPLPSGRIGLGTAHVVCALLALLALFGGEIYTAVTPDAGLSLWLVVFTGALIVFYDFAAKYLVPLGLLSLGLIRFFHAAIAAPKLPVLWHPLLLEAVRTHFLGATILGTTFDWSDFPYYFAGSGLGWFWLERLRVEKDERP